jgi:hypothetical protein
MKFGGTQEELLYEAVLEQIKKDVESGDMTAIEELIKSIPQITLIGFLSEAV